MGAEQGRKKHTYVAWTTGEIRILRANADLGLAALAELLGRTPTSVLHAASRHHISLRRPGERRGGVVFEPHGLALSAHLREDLKKRAIATVVARNMASSPQAPLCPGCGRRPIQVKTTGLCSICHLRKLAGAHRDALAEIEARRDLLTARQQVHRARAEEGT